MQDEGLEYICQTLSYLHKLKEVNFSQNEITPKGADCIEEVLVNLERLEVLDVSGNNLDKACLIKIATAASSIQKLKLFKFEEENMKPSDIAEIKGILPNLFKNTEVYLD